MPEVETINSQSGHLILKWNGRNLSSERDPIKEAQSWVHLQSELIAGAPTIIVLGLGSGFHLAQLRREWPECQIIAIESRQSIAETIWESTSSDLSEIDVVVANDMDALMSHALIRQAVKHRYALLMHPSCYITDKEFYREAKKFLLARDLKSLRFFIEQRAELKHVFDFEALVADSKKKEILSIKDLPLQKLSVGKISASHFAFFALMELIK